MLTSRLYHPAWRLIVAHGVASTLAWVIPFGALAAVIAIGQWPAVAWLSGAIGVYWALLAIGLLALELSACRAAARLGKRIAKRKLSALIKLAVAIPLAQAIYFRILMRTLRVRRVQWRNVWYKIAGPWNVRREV